MNRRHPRLLPFLLSLLEALGLGAPVTVDREGRPVG